MHLTNWALLDSDEVILYPGWTLSGPDRMLVNPDSMLLFRIGRPALDIKLKQSWKFLGPGWLFLIFIGKVLIPNWLIQIFPKFLRKTFDRKLFSLDSKLPSEKPKFWFKTNLFSNNFINSGSKTHSVRFRSSNVMN